MQHSGLGSAASAGSERSTPWRGRPQGDVLDVLKIGPRGGVYD